MLFGILFIYLFAIACLRSLLLGADDFENLQELDIQNFEQQLAGEQGKWPLTILKSLLVGTWRYLCKVYNYHDSRACGYKWSGILF
jgi:hypothetical protein